MVETAEETPATFCCANIGSETDVQTNKEEKELTVYLVHLLVCSDARLHPPLTLTFIYSPSSAVLKARPYHNALRLISTSQN